MKRLAIAALALARARRARARRRSDQARPSASAATGTPPSSHLGTKAGIFKKHGIELELIYTSGSGETLQPVISGSVDLGFAVGTLGAMAAYAKGAPVRIIGAQATGAADYWYAKADPRRSRR